MDWTDCLERVAACSRHANSRLPGGAPKYSQDFASWCRRVFVWSCAHHGAAPRQHGDDEEESAIARWISKALPRRNKALGAAPSQRKPTDEEVTLLDECLAEQNLALMRAASSSQQETARTAVELRPAASATEHVDVSATTRNEKAFPVTGQEVQLPSANEVSKRSSGLKPVIFGQSPHSCLVDWIHAETTK